MAAFSLTSVSGLASEEQKVADTAQRSASSVSGIDAYFQISERGSSVSTEVRAGITTFLAMAYIIFVNPAILSNAIDFEGSFPQLLTVTCLAAGFGTLIMGLWAKLPFALAPGMGLNAYFTFTVVFGLGYTWQEALGAVFLSGLLFLALSLTGARAWIINAIPLYLKFSITAGIGAFLAIIGFQGAGLIADDPATLVATGDWTTLSVGLAFLGLIVSGALMILRVKGALIIGIATVTAAAIVTGAEVYQGAEGMVSFPGFNDGVVGFTWPSDLIFAMDIGGALSSDAAGGGVIALGIIGVVFTFLFVDFFDTAGTFIGLSDKASMLDDDGNMTAPKAAFAVDAIATTAGAALGTSSTTTYIESAAGIEDGARTGLASVVTAALFFAALALSPLASVIPAVATAPVLILIGAMMMTGAGKVDWADYRVAIPGFLTIIGMPLTYSITNGIALGIVTHVVLMAATGKAKDVHPMMYVLAGLLVLRVFI